MNKTNFVKIGLVFILLIMSVSLFAETQPLRPSNWGQSSAGTASNPYLISNLANLRWLSEVPTEWFIDGETLVHFLQTASIDAVETNTWNN